jgi:diadenosine tetraphosphate (Ap4A) HIT family hydrolase
MLPTPPAESYIFEDEKLYICLASFPLTKGHVIVAWKDDVSDLHLLNRDDYEHLMQAVDVARNALMESLGVEKVYLMYLDEVKHVHWHLVPRYEERGFNILLHSPAETKDFSLAKDIKLAMEGSKI